MYNNFSRMKKLNTIGYLKKAEDIRRYQAKSSDIPVKGILGVVEAASSSLVTQTISSVHNESDEHSIFFCLYLIVWSRFSALFCYAVVGR